MFSLGVIGSPTGSEAMNSGVMSTSLRFCLGKRFNACLSCLLDSDLFMVLPFTKLQPRASLLGRGAGIASRCSCPNLRLPAVNVPGNGILLSKIYRLEQL